MILTKTMIRDCSSLIYHSNVSPERNEQASEQPTNQPGPLSLFAFAPAYFAITERVICLYNPRTSITKHINIYLYACIRDVDGIEIPRNGMGGGGKAGKWTRDGRSALRFRFVGWRFLRHFCGPGGGGFVWDAWRVAFRAPYVSSTMSSK